MLSHITQTFRHFVSCSADYIAKAISYPDDSKDPFEAGDLVEVREVVEYVKTPKLTTQKRPRAKAISSGKYAKNKGEKVPDWRRRIIPKYNEIKNRNLNPESKYYTTARINDFIKEIEKIEAESNQD